MAGPRAAHGGVPPDGQMMGVKPPMSDRLRASLLELIRRSSCELPADVTAALAAAVQVEEPASNAAYALRVVQDDIRLAGMRCQPLCQDTGSILFHLDAPPGFDLLACEAAAVDAVREATRRGWLRQNSVDSITGANSGDNVGPGSPSFHHRPWREERVEIRLMLKGGGCENVGAQYSLPHPELGGRDLAGAERAILRCVLDAQGQGCGPGILGVCIGGDRASGYAASKEQFLRRLDDRNGDPVLDALERRVVEQANRSGIGPMGFGGRCTLLGCKVGRLNRVPASFFVTVSYMCWAFRRQGIVLAGDGGIAEWLY